MVHCKPQIPESFQAYLDAESGARIKTLAENATFVTSTSTLERAYSIAFESGLFENSTFVVFFILCHRSLFGCLSLIACGRPQDAAGVTRRALESANLALAVKLDPSNLTRWTAESERLQRWKDRENKSHPKRLSPKLTKVSEHPIGKSLGTLMGTLSDYAVHFTPEMLSPFLHSLRSVPNGGGLTQSTLAVDYLETGRAEISRALLLTISSHLVILGCFDFCCDYRLRALPEFASAMNEIVLCSQTLRD